MRHLAALGLLCIVACSHAETVAPPNAPNPSDAPSHLPNSKAVTPQTDPGHPALASSPGQLMAPGASDTIAQALRERGFLATDDSSSKGLEKALRGFQESQGLAATGFPDHETLKKLGIDPRTVDTTLAADAGP